MAKIAIGLKVFFLWLYSGFSAFVMQSAATSAVNGNMLQPWHLFFLILFFLVMIFLPEILYLTSKEFKSFILEGAKDGDGVAHQKDLKETGILYGSLWCMRIFIGMNLAIIFGLDISYLIYITPLIGSFGTAGLAVISNVIGTRSGKE